MTSTAKKYIIVGIVFATLAIAFALLFKFNVIKYLDLYNTCTYVLYFASAAILYAGAYNRTHEHYASSNWCIFFGLLTLVGAIVMLVYGLISGRIMLW